MPEATFLQIQGVGNMPTRMIELPPGPVRIGGGAHCEVRLDSAGLGEVQCLLRRRGNTWHFQPVGPSGQVWIDGRPADHQRPIPLGVPFRVGDRWLTLRPADSAHNDWGTFDEPISIDPEPSTGPDRPRPASTPADDEERLRRWQARLDQREKWLKDRQEERRWEARWKSAGESIRARSSSNARPSPPRTSPTPPPVAAPRPSPRPTQTPPVARIIDTRRPEPLPRSATPSPIPAVERSLGRPEAGAPTPILRPAQPPSVRVPLRPGRIAIEPARSVEPQTSPIPAPTTRALVTLPSTRVAPSRPIEEPAAVEIEAEPTALESDPPTTEAPFEAREAEAERPTADVVAGSLDPIEQDEPARDEPETCEAPPATALVESSAWVEELPTEARAANWPAEVATEPAPEASPAPRESRSGDGLPNAEWPSARAIFAAQARRPHPAPEASKPSRRRSIDPQPTAALAPGQWTLPLWLAWLPVFAFVLVVGSGGVALAYGWALESIGAGNAIRLALRAEGSPGSPIDPTTIPRGGWWFSNATHLSAWAVALERSGDGEDHSEEVRSIGEAARNASQLSSRARFLLDPPDHEPEPGASPDLSHLGRTRDVVTLVATGRKLRKAGKLEASLRAYRSAMEMAARADLDDLDPPTFSEDRQVFRYALPHEALVGLVALDMVSAGDWTSEQWEAALPPTALASLSASRVLARSKKRPEADRLADLAIRQAGAPPPPGFDPAEHRAASAEALAYRQRWTDAAELYRLAIDLVDDDPTRRRWWLNLAEVAQRLNDEPARARAIEAARAPDSGDEITKRALKYQQSLSGLASSSPRP
jgi:hypothetical protein